MSRFSEKQYIMALDEGTTSVRCLIYDKSGNPISIAQSEFEQIFPKPGWVEQDAMEIWAKQIAVASDALLRENLSFKNIAGIGITNQRETTIVWDKNTGEPIYNAIVWQCRRTAEYADELIANGYSDMIREKTGLIIDAYFSATKLKWILDNVDGARERAEKGELLFGTVETWLIWKMTGGKVHVTDYSNAARTMMFNINTIDWDDEILDLIGIPRCMLPTPVESSGIVGNSVKEIFGGEIPIAGMAGDQQAALFGETCFESGQCKSTFGTGNFLLLNTGEKPFLSSNGLLTTIAWGINGKIYYALEGSVFVSGAAVQWLRDGLEFMKTSSESEDMAMSIDSCDGVYVVPAFAGLGAPYWEADARGAIFGITRGTTKNHITRATLESLAYQNEDLISSMSLDLGISIKELNVDGGASENNFLMQFQADISDMSIIRHRQTESTSLGAAYLAGLATGYFDSMEDIIENNEIERVFTPNMSKESREKHLKGWHQAVEASIWLSKKD